jgi:hypothetical protein
MGVEAKSSLVCLFVSLWYQSLFINYHKLNKKKKKKKKKKSSILMATPTASTIAVVSLQSPFKPNTHKQIILCGNTKYHHIWKVRIFLDMWMAVSHHQSTTKNHH